MRKNKLVCIAEPSHQVAATQKQYRALLDSMVRPGEIRTLPEGQPTLPEHAHRASIFIALTLFNANVPFCVAGTKSEEITDFLAATTNALPEPIARATYVLMLGYKNGEIQEVKAGKLPYREAFIPLIVEVDEISALKYGHSLELTLRKPGGEEEAKAYVSGLNPAILEHVKEQNRLFPPRLDLILTDKENTILYIPTTYHFSWQPRLWMNRQEMKERRPFGSQMP